MLVLPQGLLHSSPSEGMQEDRSLTETFTEFWPRLKPLNTQSQSRVHNPLYHSLECLFGVKYPGGGGKPVLDNHPKIWITGFRAPG